jgi:hypothetical protein
MVRRYRFPISAVALDTNAKTRVNVIAGASEYIAAVTEMCFSTDTADRILVEICESTQAGAGTGSSDVTSSLKQVGGFVGADGAAPIQVTVRTGYSGEPTTLTALAPFIFTGTGPVLIQAPLGRELQSLVSGATKYKALAFRIKALTGTPNLYGWIEFEV